MEAKRAERDRHEMRVCKRNWENKIRMGNANRVETKHAGGNDMRYQSKTSSGTVSEAKQAENNFCDFLLKQKGRNKTRGVATRGSNQKQS